MGYTDREDDADDLDERDDPLEEDMDSTDDDEWDADVEEEQRTRPWVIVATIVILVLIALGAVLWY